MKVWVVLEQTDYEEWTVRGAIEGTYDDAAELASRLGIQPYNTGIEECELFTK